MGARRIAAFAVAAAFALLGCGLDVAGLGVASEGGVDESGSDALATSDVSVPDSDDGPVESTVPGDGAETGSFLDAPVESTTDSPALPTCPPGVTCNGVCSAASDCHACGGATLLCASTNTCAGSCGSCATSSIECYACDANRQNPIGTCQPFDSTAYCLSTNYAGAYGGQQGYHCGCTTAADCPGDSQVCIAVGAGPFACFTCGEAYTKNFACKAGGKCNDTQALCN